ncbi:MAG: hypothetical protein AB7P17_07715 [Nitrospirales bacterium]|nr:hypothetical protein [Nitrospirales bacterium]
MIGVTGKIGILGVLVTLILYGCDFRRVVVNDPLITDSLDELVPGKSTVRDVAQKLGAPDEIEEGMNGMVFRYRYAETSRCG